MLPSCVQAFSKESTLEIYLCCKLEVASIIQFKIVLYNKKVYVSVENETKPAPFPKS